MADFFLSPLLCTCLPTPFFSHCPIPFLSIPSDSDFRFHQESLYYGIILALVPPNLFGTPKKGNENHESRRQYSCCSCCCVIIAGVKWFFLKLLLKSAFFSISLHLSFSPPPPASLHSHTDSQKGGGAGGSFQPPGELAGRVVVRSMPQLVGSTSTFPAVLLLGQTSSLVQGMHFISSAKMCDDFLDAFWL